MELKQEPEYEYTLKGENALLREDISVLEAQNEVLRKAIFAMIEANDDSDTIAVNTIGRTALNQTV